MMRLLPVIALSLGFSAPGAFATTVIVELNEPPAARDVAEARLQGVELSEQELAERRAELLAGQADFLQALESRGVSFTIQSVDVPDYEGNTTPVELRYTLVLNGVALDVPESAIDTIEAMPQVRKVHLERILTPQLDNSVDYIRAPEVYGEIAELTPFDDFREGLEGHGINVAILDTGIEWSHEMFGADSSPPRLGLMPPNAALNSNEKVIYYLPLHDAVVDDFGHGTHVSADAAGYQGFEPGPDGLPLTADDVPIHGVAPQARLMGYKVCSGIGSAAQVLGCLSSQIILALEDSVSPRTLNGFPKPVAHVINISLGGPGGPDDATSRASDNATLMGSIVVSSAGNSGPGEGTVGSPAAGRHVIAVGANNDPGVSQNPDMAGFSSRGPVQGLGQVKPDVTAPGVSVLSATSPVGVPLLSMQSATRYTSASGTSFSSPHVAGVAALLKQAHPGWGSAEVRTALINTATNLRFPDGTPKADGPGSADSVIDQGGGLVDVAEAADARALMGVTGDGIEAPSILGSHSFADVPVVNSRVTHTETVNAEIRDISGEGGTYELSIVNNRDLEVAGVGAGVTPASVIVAPGGAAGFTASATVDGDRVRRPLVAKNGDLEDFFEETEIFRGTILAGTLNSSLEPDVDFQDTPFEVGAETARLNAVLEFDVLVDGLFPDLDLFLFNPDGEEIARSATFGGPEAIQIEIDRPGTYTYRVTGWTNGPTDYRLSSTQGGEVVVEPLQMQWYVQATRSDGGETLRMPLYLKPVGSQPLDIRASTTVFEDILPASDTNLELVEDVTFKDFPVEVDDNGFELNADLEFIQVVDGPPDLDLFLLDPDGDEIAFSGNFGGPEHITRRIDRAGTYTWRVTGFANGPTPFTLTSTLRSFGPGVRPPVLDPIEGDFVDSGDRPVDFDGNLSLNWQPVGDPVSLEIERSVDGGDFELIAEAAGDATSLALTDQPDGELAFRLRALFPGQIGFFVTAPGNTETVVVDRRSQVEITDQVKSALSNVVFADGVFAFDLRLTNQSAQDFLPLVEFNIVNIDSASGTVAVINADNGGSGTSPEDPALFDYSHELGDDDTFSAGETTGARRLQFSDEAAELFTFDAVVTAFENAGTAAKSQEAETTSDKSGDGGVLLRFTVNPLTGAVDVELITLDGIL